MYNVTIVKAGPQQLLNFIYFLVDPNSRDAVIIDPAWDCEVLIETIDKYGLSLKAIILTHSHGDHVSAVEPLTNNISVPVYMMRQEIEHSSYRVRGLVPCHHEETIIAGTVNIISLHTPGHTTGSACYFTGDALFTGDTLFIEGCGHCHHPGGSAEEMYNSVRYLKNTIDSNTLIYPGHQYRKAPGMPLSLVQKMNIYLNLADKEEFVRFCSRRIPRDD